MYLCCSLEALYATTLRSLYDRSTTVVRLYDDCTARHASVSRDIERVTPRLIEVKRIQNNKWQNVASRQKIGSRRKNSRIPLGIFKH